MRDRFDHHPKDGSVNITRIMRERVKCPSCSNMDRLMDFRVTDVGHPFVVKSGKYEGRTMIVRKYENVNLNLEIVEPSLIAIENLLSRTPIFGKCTYDKEDYLNCIYISSDRFTHELITSIYIQNILHNNDIDGLEMVHGGFVCGNDGYVLQDNGLTYKDLTEIPSLMYNNTFSEENILSIIQQIVNIYNVLNKYSFTHGSPDASSLRFEIFNGRIVVKMTELDKSGIFVKTVDECYRLYSYDEDEEILLDNSTPLPLIEVIEYNVYKDGVIDTENVIFAYKVIKNENLSHLMFMKHVGAPLYNSSYDIYSFIFSLMKKEQFYNGVMESERLTEIWRGMWLPFQLEEVNEYLERVNHHEEVEDNGDMINYYLRCDVLDYLNSVI
jgi:hypothetical protein